MAPTVNFLSHAERIKLANTHMHTHTSICIHCAREEAETASLDLPKDAPIKKSFPCP